MKKKILEKPEKKKLVRTKGTARAGDKIRMRMVFEDAKANNFKSMSKSLAKFGYSPTMSPSNITRTKTWKEIMEEAMPDTLLAEKHAELLHARHKVVVREKEWDEDGGFEMVDRVVDLGPDLGAVSKGLEMAYKLKGSFNPRSEDDASRPSQSTIYNLFYKPEIRNSVKQLEAALTKQLYGEPLKDDDGTIPENFGGSSTTYVEPAGEDGGGVDEGDTGEDDSVKE